LTLAGLSVAGRIDVNAPAKILLIEDSEPDVCLVREALEHCGLEFELQVFEDGESGMDYIEGIDREAVSRPGLILLDLNLPKKGGAQVLERIRRSSACAEIPVVILTSSDSPKDRALTASLGATEYFRKPSQLNEFMLLGPLTQRLLKATAAG
jgi:DNA-binding response OmpR family regulator